MPTYQYICDSCTSRFTSSQAREHRATCDCSVCGAKARQIVGGVNVFLKGDEWAGKSLLLREQMQRKNERLRTRQSEKAREAPEYRLVPNVNGEEVGTWREAAKYAKSKGLATEAYQVLAENEAAR